jgi:L-ascorbate metabolism protein UlaG (beta-lactamase superfamily)
MATGWRWVIGGAFAAMLAMWAGQAPAQSGAVKMEWLSWSVFRFTSPTGKVIVTNPFVANPDSPVKVADFPKVDVILVADGHGDEVGSTDEIAIKTGARIVSTFEMWNTYFQPRHVPEAQMFRSNPGDWLKLDGLTIRNVNAVHGSGTPDKLDGGAAMGFMIHFENGLTVYFAGSSALTLDMQLWGRLYKPDVAILPLKATSDPQDIIEMVRLLRTENPNLKTIIPHHHRLQPPAGATTPAVLDSALRASGLPVTLLNPDLKKVYELTK